MPHPTRLLHRALPALQSTHVFTPASPAVYSIGLSYAGKNSPPFVPPDSPYPRTGFAHMPRAEGGAIREWVRASGEITAGRGELEGASVGGWRDDVKERTRAWGAGEDFYVVQTAGTVESDTPASSMVHLAVSDGVGGWASGDDDVDDVVDEGQDGSKGKGIGPIDPSLYAQALMFHYAQSAREDPERSPYENLARAYEGVLKTDAVVAGSATAVGVRLSKDGSLQGVNLGDSGCLIIRNGSIVLSTPPLTHYFNCPKQLSKIPEVLQSRGSLQDTPQVSDTFAAQLAPADVIVLFSDGLSDNVPESHMVALLAHVQKLLESETNAHLDNLDRARELARLYADVLVAYGRSAMCRTGQEMDETPEGPQPSWKTPFEVESIKNIYDPSVPQALKVYCPGGKIDDITVVVAVVGEANPEDD